MVNYVVLLGHGKAEKEDGDMWATVEGRSLFEDGNG